MALGAFGYRGRCEWSRLADQTLDRLPCPSIIDIRPVCREYNLFGLREASWLIRLRWCVTSATRWSNGIRRPSAASSPMASCTRTPECPRRKEPTTCWLIWRASSPCSRTPTSTEWETSPAAGEVVLTERVDMITDFDGRLHGVPVMGTFVVDGGKICRWTDYFDTGLIGKMLGGEDYTGLVPQPRHLDEQ